MSSEVITKTDLKYILNRLYASIDADKYTAADLDGNEVNVQELLDEIYSRLDPTINIGKVYSATSSKAITTASVDTHVEGATITVPAGTYYVVGQWAFNTRTASGTTNSQVSIKNKTANSLVAFERLLAAGYNWNAMQCHTVLTLTQQTVLCVTGSSSRLTSGTAQENWIKAVKLV